VLSGLDFANYEISTRFRRKIFEQEIYDVGEFQRQMRNIPTMRMLLAIPGGKICGQG
jgi:hypothetical protein